MHQKEFREYAHQLVDWIADYQENIIQYPVKSNVKPKDIIQQLPLLAPEEAEDFSAIFNDFKQIILPGITHWQHPKFFAYYPANTSAPSILAEMLTAALGVQCMSWQTSPAATELEERVMEWLVKMLGLPDCFTGVIQDSASTATLCSLLTAREKATRYATNQYGLYEQTPFTLYCSEEAHSSIEKAVKMAGLGHYYLRKIAVDAHYAMKPELLETAIREDKEKGLQPLWVVSAIGTTGSTAIDPLHRIGEICSQYQIWLHVDAAYAGAAFLLPEMRTYLKGIEYADSFVFNPHKWMLTNFDCSAYFVKDKEALIQCFEILPEYLKTKETTVNNYRDWGTSLGRRFRALKLWFVIRSYGVNNLRRMIRNHINMAQRLATQIANSSDFEIMAPVLLNNICFRYHPRHIDDSYTLNQLNTLLLDALNATGKIYLTHTKLANSYVLRLVIGQTTTQSSHVDEAWTLIQEISASLILSNEFSSSTKDKITAYPFPLGENINA